MIPEYKTIKQSKHPMIELILFLNKNIEGNKKISKTKLKVQVYD